jgi:hypothetical protein
MFTFVIKWESGKTTILDGDSLKDAIHRVGHHACVLKRVVSHYRVNVKIDLI